MVSDSGPTEPLRDDFSCTDSSSWQYDKSTHNGKISLTATVGGNPNSVQCLSCGRTWQLPNGTGLIPFAHDCCPTDAVADGEPTRCPQCERPAPRFYCWMGKPGDASLPFHQTGAGPCPMGMPARWELERRADGV